MRILVVSDTHSHVQGILKKLKEEISFDMLVFLGDFAADGERIKEALKIPSHIIAGNGDWQTNYPREQHITVEGRKILLTHGHKYNVKNDLNRLYYHALESGANVVLFGHTHVPMRRIDENLIMMNPASPSLPRGGLTTRSYGILEIGQKIDARICYMRQG